MTKRKPDRTPCQAFSALELEPALLATATPLFQNHQWSLFYLVYMLLL